MEKKSEVSEHNFTEGKAIHYLCSIEQCVKLSFMIKNFEKWREVVVLKFFNLVLKKYGKWYLKFAFSKIMKWEPCDYFIISRRFALLFKWASSGQCFITTYNM